MAKRRIKCSKCSRSFGMPAHLVRHMSTHKRGGAKKSSTKKAKGRRGAPRAVRRAKSAPLGGRATMSFQGDAPFLADMQAYHADLSAQRATLDSQIDRIESAIHTLQASPSATGPRRGRPAAGRVRAGRASGFRAGSLKEHLVSALRRARKPLTLGQLESAVRAAGYKTKSKDLVKPISNSIRDIASVKKVRRGLYRV